MKCFFAKTKNVSFGTYIDFQHIFHNIKTCLFLHTHTLSLSYKHIHFFSHTHTNSHFVSFTFLLAHNTHTHTHTHTNTLTAEKATQATKSRRHNYVILY